MLSEIFDDVKRLALDKEVQIMLLAEKYAMADIATMRLNDRAEGRAEGEDRVTKLYRHLMSLGNTEDLEKAMNDKTYREQLMKTLGL